MVQILRPPKSFGAELAGNIGRGLGEGLSTIADRKRQDMLLSQENEAIRRETGVDLSGIRDPQSRHAFLADALTRGRKQKQAESSQNIDYDIGKIKGGDLTRGAPQQSQQSAVREDWMDLGAEEIPLEIPMELREQTRREKDIGKNKKPRSNMPGESLDEEIFPELNPDEIRQVGQQIAQQKTDQGIPTTVEEGMAEASALNQERALHNQNVRLQQERRKVKQEEYGNKGAQKAQQIIKDRKYNNTPLELEEYFRKRGEDLALTDMTEADKSATLTKEAMEVQNELANLDKKLPPSHKLEKLQGLPINTKEHKGFVDDVRANIKPLLDKGLHAMVRYRLSDMGFYPESTEAIMGDLSENARKIIGGMPKLNKPEGFARPAKKQGLAYSPAENTYTSREHEMIRDNIRDVFLSDPAVNPVLLRSALSEKGVNWREVKDSINDLEREGVIQLNSDQKNLVHSVLDEPPLRYLDEILKYVKFRK